MIISINKAISLITTQTWSEVKADEDYDFEDGWCFNHYTTGEWHLYSYTCSGGDWVDGSEPEEYSVLLGNAASGDFLKVSDQQAKILQGFLYSEL